MIRGNQYACCALTVSPFLLYFNVFYLLRLLCTMFFFQLWSGMVFDAVDHSPCFILTRWILTISVPQEEGRKPKKPIGTATANKN